jgi:Fic family protein
LIIANFLVEFLQIHPFQDGNGRLSRILTNLLMLQAGYTFVPYVSQEKLIEDNKPDYYLSLRQSQTTFKTERETIVPWLEFFLSVVHRQARLAVELVAAESAEKLLSPTQIMVWDYLQAVNEAAPRTLSERLDIPRSTINQVVNKLIDLGMIERIGMGRATRYRVITSD